MVSYGPMTPPRSANRNKNHAIDITVGSYRCPFETWTPQMGRIFEMFAYDTETTDMIEDRPDLTPDLVIGTACDGNRGVYLTRDTVLPFFQAHADVPFICHNAAFDLRSYAGRSRRSAMTCTPS